MSKQTPKTKPLDENPEWTDEMFARARPPAEVLPPEVLAAFKRPRGRPKVEAPKEKVTIRLDADVVAAWRAKGAGWQTKVNDLLREHAEA